MQRAAVVQRRVSPNAAPGTPVVVTNPVYKTRYRAVGRVVRASRHDQHLVVALNGVQTPRGADGFRFHVNDLDHAPVHQSIDVVPSGRRTFVLVGTTHGRGSPDLSGNVDPLLLSGSTLVLEYPSLAGTGRTAFDAGEHDKILDNTQNQLARTAASRGDVTIVGADARKALLDGWMQGLSVRHKDQDLYRTDHEHASRRAMRAIFSGYVQAALSGTDLGPAIAQLQNAITYGDGTDAGGVLKAGCSRLRTLWKQMSRRKVELIVKHAEEGLKRDLAAAKGDYREEKPRYAKYGYPLDSLNKVRDDAYLSALYDAISNLSLLTEALASTSSKVIVAFGAEHMVPLQGLLRDLNALNAQRH